MSWLTSILKLITAVLDFLNKHLKDWQTAAANRKASGQIEKKRGEAHDEIDKRIP